MGHYLQDLDSDWREREAEERRKVAKEAEALLVEEGKQHHGFLLIGDDGCLRVCPVCLAVVPRADELVESHRKWHDHIEEIRRKLNALLERKDSGKEEAAAGDAQAREIAE